jgi:hypothetical protein
LDYKNEPLAKLSKMFNKSFAQSSYNNIIIKATSKEKLLQKYENLLEKYPQLIGIGNFVFSQKKCSQKLKKLYDYDFETLKKMLNDEAKKVGFSHGFKNAYVGIKDVACSYDVPKESGFGIVEDNGWYFTVAFMPKDVTVRGEEGVFVFDVAKMLQKDMQKSKNIMMKFALIAFLFVIFVLLLNNKKDIFYPLAFILFPFGVVLFFITMFGKINLMHIFALIILVAISIDYGIYMQGDDIDEAKEAIKYALLSTLAGFGVLIFSNVVALNSMGFVIFIGILTIFLLI